MGLMDVNFTYIMIQNQFAITTLKIALSPQNPQPAYNMYGLFQYNRKGSDLCKQIKR